jgi:hypothetical protein
MKQKSSFFAMAGLLLGVMLYSSCNDTSDPNAPITVVGCTDNQSLNYNPKATKDDGSCLYASSTAMPRSALIEVFTGVRGMYCPEMQAAANTLEVANPSRVVVINIHTGPYAVLMAGWPDYTTSYGQAIADTAGMSYFLVSYPAASVNRYHFWDVPAVKSEKYVNDSNYTNLKLAGINPAVNDRLAQISPVNIGISTKYDQVTRTLTVLTELYYTATETYPNYLNVALLENSVIGKQQNKTQIDTAYVQNHILRHLLTGQWGVVVSSTLATNRIKNTYTYKVPTNVAMQNADVAVFVTREIGGRKVDVISVKKKKLQY